MESSQIEPVSVYIIMGIDAQGHDQVLSVCCCYEKAKRYCITYLAKTQYYDLWIEKHPLMGTLACDGLT